MKIVAVDGYALSRDDLAWEKVEKLGELTVYDRMAPEDVAEAAKEAEILLVNKVPISAETIGRLSSLKFISMTATGYDCVDIEAFLAGSPVNVVNAHFLCGDSS